MADTPSIDRVIVDVILAGRIRAGTRLGEQSLATLFATSRTSVREALIRLEARGIVHVSPRRGWFVTEPSLEEAQEAFQSCCAIEMGILRTVTAIPDRTLSTLRDHIVQSVRPSPAMTSVPAASCSATSTSAGWRRWVTSS